MAARLMREYKDPYLSMVFGVLAMRSRDDGKKVFCFPSVKKIAEDAGMSVRKTEMMLKKLTQIGVIERRYQANYQSKATVLFL